MRFSEFDRPVVHSIIPLLMRATFHAAFAFTVIASVVLALVMVMGCRRAEGSLDEVRQQGGVRLPIRPGAAADMVKAGALPIANGFLARCFQHVSVLRGEGNLTR